MLEEFLLKNKDITLGLLSRQDNGSFVFKDFRNTCNPKLYPYEFYHWSTEEIFSEVPSSNIYDFLDNRTTPIERQGIQAFLSSLGLTCYDMWEICKRTRATTIEDMFWLAKSESEDFNDYVLRFKLKKDFYKSEGTKDKCVTLKSSRIFN